ncbi:MAG TPA: hypothetical protein ENK97_01570 [Campylobacteraceae bacterium]|nr:hypothetical protein [Campylobacteraceae bacterium]
MNTEKEKAEKLRQIEELLNTYGGTLEIAPYVLRYLSPDELDSIIISLLEQQSNVIEANHEWLQQFKKVKK